MLAAIVIVFREVLEAALVISIVLAATRGLSTRLHWVGSGALLGILGAGLIALFTQQISQLASGMGQELLNATVLLAAVVMLAWHAIWMAQHGKELTQQMRAVSGGVLSGYRPPYVLLIAVALAVLREGAEVVLFLYGMLAGGAGIGQVSIGGLFGLLLGIVVGALLYFGLLRVPLKYFFTVTNWMILLLAAGMASQAAGYLIQADVIPAWGNRLWDTSMIISDQSVVGQMLKTLIGYEPRPAGIQLAFYLITAIFIYVGMKTCGQMKKIVAPPAHLNRPLT